MLKGGGGGGWRREGGEDEKGLGTEGGERGCGEGKGSSRRSLRNQLLTLGDHIPDHHVYK